MASKKYVKPDGSSRVSFAYSLESEGGSDVLFGEIVILRHLHDTVAAEITVSDHIGRNPRAGDDRSPETDLGIHHDRSVIILRDPCAPRRSNAGVKQENPSRSAMDTAKEISDDLVQRPLPPCRNVDSSPVVDDVDTLIGRDGELRFRQRMRNRNLSCKRLRDPVRADPPRGFSNLQPRLAGTRDADAFRSKAMTDREAKSRAVKILAKSIYRDLEAQGFDERQIVALATELISEVTTKISVTRDNVKSQVA